VDEKRSVRIGGAGRIDDQRSVSGPIAAIAIFDARVVGAVEADQNMAAVIIEAVTEAERQKIVFVILLIADSAL
jgi:hypothetical protein